MAKQTFNLWTNDVGEREMDQDDGVRNAINDVMKIETDYTAQRRKRSKRSGIMREIMGFLKILFFANSLRNVRRYCTLESTHSHK